MSTATPPPGWYDDPDHSDQLRWWDGMAWTDYRRTADGTQVAQPSVSTQPTPTATFVEPAPGSGTATRSAGELASAGDRLLAYLLDAVIGVALFFAAFIVSSIVGAVSETLGSLVALVAFVAVVAVLFISGVMGVGRLGQSYGKHLMGLRVVSTHTGRPVGSPAAFGRGIMLAIGSSIYVLFLGVLWILWDPQRQGWHDKVVSSIVVQDPSPTKLDPVAYLRAVLDR